MTLVELLITIAIVALLAGMVMLAMQSATESAKAAKTKALVAKLNTIIQQKYESYQTRRVSLVVPAGTAPRQAARARLDALRDLMRMEMPERWSDIVSAPATNVVTGTQLPSPPLREAYKARYQALVSQNPAWADRTYEGAECLYLIVTLGQSEGVADLPPFPAGSIGDVDHDGMLEFLDGWGRPIQFLRWAPGFVSDLQPADPAKRAADPFDPQHVYPWTTSNPRQPEQTFAVYPLIYSAGPDGQYDILTDGPQTGSPGTYLQYRLLNNNPFATTDASGFPLGPIGSQKDLPEDGPGTPVPNGISNWHDNIHNHLQLNK